MTTYEAVAVPQTKPKRTHRLTSVVAILATILFLPLVIFAAIAEGFTGDSSELEHGDGFGA